MINMKKNKKHQVEEFSWPRVIIVHEVRKIYLDASSESAFERSMLRILKARLEDSQRFLFSDEERLDAERVCHRKLGFDAWAILQNRNSEENEFVEHVKIQVRLIEEE